MDLSTSIRGAPCTRTVFYRGSCSDIWCAIVELCVLISGYVFVDGIRVSCICGWVVVVRSRAARVRPHSSTAMDDSVARVDWRVVDAVDEAWASERLPDDGARVGSRS